MKDGLRPAPHNETPAPARTPADSPEVPAPPGRPGPADGSSAADPTGAPRADSAHDAAASGAHAAAALRATTAGGAASAAASDGAPRATGAGAGVAAGVEPGGTRRADSSGSPDADAGRRDAPGGAPATADAAVSDGAPRATGAGAGVAAGVEPGGTRRADSSGSPDADAGRRDAPGGAPATADAAAADGGPGEAPAGPDGDDGTDDEDVPWSEEDDDRTDEALAWLRRKRRAHRRAKGREMAVLVYTVLIAVAGYGSSFAVSFLRGLEDGSGYADAARDLRAAMPALFGLLTVGVAVLAARDALWRGPVVVPGPTVGWLLAQPVRRGRVLRPWFRLSAGLALIPGLLAWLGGAAVLRVTGLAPMGTALLAALPAALCLPLLAVALGMVVERRPGVARAVRRWTAPAVLLLAALVAQTVLAVNGHRSPAVEQVELWSGPWGWAGQPVVDAIGGSAPGWPAAVALLAAATAASLLAAYRDAALVPTARLRERAATATTVSSVAWSLELRAAKLAIMDAGGGTPVRQIRLRPPRGRYGRHLVVAWRDTLTLLRTPGRLGKAALWTAAGAAVAGLGADLGGERRWVGLIIGLLFGYLAVGALAEPARLETDDVRRAAWAPYRFRTLMLHHGIVPALLGAALGLLAAVPYAVAGHPWTLVLLPLCALPFTGAALVSAARGPARTQLLFLGGGSPMGGPGPLIYVAWYAAGPLLALTALTFALGPVLHHATAAAVTQAAVVSVLLTSLLLLLTTRMSDRLLRH